MSFKRIYEHLGYSEREFPNLKELIEPEENDLDLGEGERRRIFRFRRYVAYFVPVIYVQCNSCSTKF